MKITCNAMIMVTFTLTATSSFAQELTGAATLGFGLSDVSDISEDIDTLTLNGRFGLAAANGFRFGVDLNSIKGSFEDTSEDVTATLFGAYGGYQFEGGGTAGGYIERANLDTGSLLGDLSANSYGLLGGYDFEGGGVGGFVGMTTTDPDLPDDVDIYDYGIKLKFAASDKFTMGISAVRTTISGPGDEVGLGFYGIAGSYTVTETVSIFGGLSTSTLDDVDADLTSFGIGVNYDLAEATGVNASLSMELARSNLSIGGTDGSIDTVRFGFSIPLGKSDFSVPLNSVADAVINPRHSVISSTVLAAF